HPHRRAGRTRSDHRGRPSGGVSTTDHWQEGHTRAMTGIQRAGAATDAARQAMSRGLLASGINVDGVVASNNAAVAKQLFRQATELDPAMCDAWLARIV